MLSKPKSVIPAEAGIQCFNYLDADLATPAKRESKACRARRCDELNQCFPSHYFR